MAAGCNADQGRAARYLARVNIEIIKAAGARRQRQARGAGARLPASLAGAPVRLTAIKSAGSTERPETPPGYRTARRALPLVLSELAEHDPRLKAARMLADTCERVGSVKGADLAGTDAKGGQSDGGATTRVKHAARLRMIEALANGWPVERRHGPRRGMPRVALEMLRQSRPDRQQIMVFDALMAVCVDGLELAAVLRRYGWSVQAKPRVRLRAAVLAALDDVADGLGLGRGGANKSA